MKPLKFQKLLKPLKLQKPRERATTFIPIFTRI